MDIILLERVGKLGQMGDVVSVKDGFARNFLLPQKKALRATEANKKYFESQRVELEAQNLERKKDAEAIAGKLDGASYVLLRQAGETGQLYGSVSSRDIASAAEEAGVRLARNQVILDKPLKALGLYDVRVVLHPEVEVSVQINIARSEDEAERQARGEDVLSADRDEDDDDGLSAEDVFEDEALAGEAEARLADGEDAPTDADAESVEASNEDGESQSR